MKTRKSNNPFKGLVSPEAIQTTAILWQGPSEIDGAPIMLVGVLKSGNGKTGALVQTYIIRSDVDPRDAVNQGLDASICGDCKHRGPIGKRTCYVNIGQGVLRVYDAFERGRYGFIDPTGRQLFAGLKVRMGTYGDPAAIPFEVWAEVLDGAAGWTGYTHQWTTCDPRFRDYCMASADTMAERALARSGGWRCFVVIPETATKPKGAATCPASEEAGRKLQCSECMACDGAFTGKRSDIAIKLHGSASIKKQGRNMADTLDHGFATASA